MARKIWEAGKVEVREECSSQMTRNEQIIQEYSSGELTLKQVGEKYGITRERVRQIVGKAGITGRRVRERVKNETANMVAARRVGAWINSTRCGAVYGSFRDQIEAAFPGVYPVAPEKKQVYVTHPDLGRLSFHWVKNPRFQAKNSKRGYYRIACTSAGTHIVLAGDMLFALTMKNDGHATIYIPETVEVGETGECKYANWAAIAKGNPPTAPHGRVVLGRGA